MEWTRANYFKQPFIQLGKWRLDRLSSFPHVDFVGADTETKLYYNNELLTEEKAHDLYQKNGATWCRENIEVRAYAFMLSDGESFALFQNAEDFLTCCAMLLVKQVFWYNARFDFAIFDYYFFTNEWKSSDNRLEELKKEKRYGRLPDKTYQSLNGDYGQRYSYKIWKGYTDRTSHKKVHSFKMLDICNIFPGGLKKNLIDWGIQDKDGNEVRKLSMDYVNASIEDDIDYMVADTKGLALLTLKIEETIKKISGLSLFKGDYMTAGGLAKKSMLKFMFKESKNADNIELFHQFFPITLEEDRNFRNNGLYQGGKCLVNPYKVGKIQHNIYKYDVNSMYPAQMRSMKYPIGKPRVLKELPPEEEQVGKCYIYAIDNIMGYLKPDMIGVWYDNVQREYVDKINEVDMRYFWKEELDELDKWYYLLYNKVYLLEYDCKEFKGAKDFIDNYYDLKCNSKGSIKRGAKLFLNSSYGKISQRVERVKCEYELSVDGYVHLVKGDVEIDEKSMMSVVVGSRITALARVMLLNYIREICQGNVKKNFIYCDTDSVHSLTYYANTDDKELGKMKNEGTYSWGKYLAPKTYLLYDNQDEERNQFEVHTKGVNTNVVLNEILKCKSLDEVDKIFASGKTYRCLTALNVKGGKALIYIDKMLLNPLRDKSINDDEIYEGNNGNE